MIAISRLTTSSTKHLLSVMGAATGTAPDSLRHHPAAGACRAKSSPGRSHEHPCGQGFGPHGASQFDDLSGAWSVLDREDWDNDAPCGEGSAGDEYD